MLVDDVAVTVMLKLGAGEVTVRVEAGLLWLNDPLVPVATGENVPVPPPLDVATVIWVVPDPVTVVGLKLADAPEGSPDPWKLTTPVNEFIGVTVTVYVALPPATMVVEELGAMPTLKSAGGGAVPMA